MHYVGMKSNIYSINEWILYCKNFQEILKIPLFRNYKVKKIYELWKRFMKKTKKTFFTDKLSRKFHRIDDNLLRGLFEIRRVLKEMSSQNIFAVIRLHNNY